MNRYSKRKRSTKERIGFYTALSICMVAVGMAAYSTYSTMSSRANSSSDIVAVERVVTGVTVANETEKPTEPTTAATQPTTEKPTEPPTEETEFSEETAPEETKSALETMLTVNTSLSFPLDKSEIIQPYSEETVYNKTLNDWRAHTGIDFACNEGDSVYSMGEGEAVKLYEDDLLGNTLVVKSATYTAYYSGLKNITVTRGSKVKTGDVIATAGTVPSEKHEKNHIHIAIKVGGQYIDPLELIHSNE